MNIKKQFSEMRKNTPKHIQWLLLAAAFVVVIILLTLLLTNHEEEVLESNGDVAITLGIVPDTIEWPDVSVGDTKTETIKVTASAPIKIVGVNLEHDIPGLKQPIQQTCTSMGQIDADKSQYIRLFLTKNTIWQYQKEWRIIGNANEKIKAPKISAVHIGKKISKENRIKMEQFCIPRNIALIQN